MKLFLILFIFTLLITGCKSIEQKMFEKDPFYESFYLSTRFIMTKYERNMYKFLPDKTSKEKFINEFWLRRDPTPDTKINENHEAFKSRIAYANKYFTERTKGHGWDTIRGRILLQLGFPIERRKDQYNLQSQSVYVPYELWYYPRFELVLAFIDRKDSGKFELFNPPPGLLSNIDEAIYEFDMHYKFRGKSSFRFKGKYKGDNLIIKFPTKHIRFKEDRSFMIIKLKLNIGIYMNYKKIKSIFLTKNIKMESADLLKLKNLIIFVPIQIKQKGRYYFDILIEDVINKSRYRRFVSFKK